MPKIVRLYVVRCKTPGHWYCGTTDRLPWYRAEEHAGLKPGGAKWTHLHGYDTMVFSVVVPTHMGPTLEDDMTKWLMSVYGWGQCRGGNFVRVRNWDDMDTFWLPREFRPGASFRDILELRSGRVSKFSTELRGLVDCFCRFCDSEGPNHLDSKAFSETLLRQVPQHLEHVPPAELLTCALCS